MTNLDVFLILPLTLFSIGEQASAGFAMAIGKDILYESINAYKISIVGRMYIHKPSMSYFDSKMSD